MNNEELQRQHFDNIMSEYERHYDDECSQRYRDEFMYNPLFKDMDLANKNVLEGMCGSGQATKILLSKGAIVTGLDISFEGIKSFQAKWKECKGICVSMLETGLPDRTFDSVVIISGLHHLHPNVDQAIDEISRILKPGGSFFFVEPHAGSLPDKIRKIWYKKDKYFEDNEASIDLDNLKNKYKNTFEFEYESYGGNVAYFLVLQSLILRIPLSWKKFYTPFMLWIEAFIQPFQSKTLSCFVLGRWRKKLG